MTTLAQFIYDVGEVLRRQDALALNKLLEINPPNNTGSIVAQFNEPNDFDLYKIDDKFGNVIKSYIKLMKSIYQINNIKQSFESYNELVIHLNRYAEFQTNWINLTLMKCCKELIGIYNVMENVFPEEIKLNKTSSEIINQSSTTSSLESLANTINKSFKLSLNDKNLDLSQSKRIDIYFFLSILIKIYFKLGNIELAKSIEKALKGTRSELPKLDKHLNDKSSAITYLYYSAILSLENSDFKATQDKLEQSLTLLSYINDTSKCEKHWQKILILLIPIKFFNEGKLPKPFIYKNFPLLDYFYHQNLFKFLISGQLQQYNNFINKFQSFLLRSNLYLLFEYLKQICFISLIKKTVKIHQQLNNDTATNHIVPFSAFSIAFSMARHGTPSYTSEYDEVECKLAGLIAEGRIKGYLSHGNQCIVLSKSVPFP